MGETTNTSTAQALRAAADFIAQHADLPLPYVTTYRDGQISMAYYLTINGFGGPEKQRSAAQAIIRAVGGRWDKNPNDHDEMNFRAERGALQFHVQIAREAVCERIVTGTETVTIPAVEAQPARTEVVETVEWRCLPLLADEEAAA